MPPVPEFQTSIDIDAEPEFVFRFLTTNDGMTAWMGQWADLDPRVGGKFDVNIAGTMVRGQYLEVEPPHRVVMSWGFVGSADLPIGSSTVAFTLTPTETGTRVDLRHSDLPERHVPGHSTGWAHFLLRLEQSADGVVLGPDTWRPDNPTM